MTLKELKNEIRRLNWHTWSNEEWLKQHQRLCDEALEQGEDAVRLITGSLFDRITDPQLRPLLVAWDHVHKRSGSTPGVDGLTTDMFTESQKCDYLRQVWRSIVDGTYSHDGTRIYRLRKKDGTYREIQIPTLADRVVQRAIVEVLQPLLDRQFYPWSFGYRPRLSRFHALAAAESLAESGRTEWLVQDLANAFDRVPIERALQVLQTYTHDPRIITLARNALSMGNACGLMQGGPLSPLLMNTYLTPLVDQKWIAVHPELAHVRFADNFLIACRSVDEAEEARRDFKTLLLPAGFRLKKPKPGECTIRRLDRGQSANFLGFDVTLSSSGLLFSIPADSWEALSDQVRLAAHPHEIEDEADADPIKFEKLKHARVKGGCDPMAQGDGAGISGCSSRRRICQGFRHK